MKTLFVDGPIVWGTLVATSTPTEIKVGASRLEDRKFITVQNTEVQDQEPVYWGYDNTVTVANGFILYENTAIRVQLSDTTEVWVVTESGKTVELRIAELA